MEPSVAIVTSGAGIVMICFWLLYWSLKMPSSWVGGGRDWEGLVWLLGWLAVAYLVVKLSGLQRGCFPASANQPANSYQTSSIAQLAPPPLVTFNDFKFQSSTACMALCQYDSPDCWVGLSFQYLALASLVSCLISVKICLTWYSWQIDVTCPQIAIVIITLLIQN